MRRLLLVDDEINVLHALKRTLRQHLGDQDLTIELFTEPDKALVRSGEVAFDVVISDYRMPGLDGVDFLKLIKAIQPDAVRLMLSASSEFGAVVDAVNEAEVFRYIAKPWQAVEIEEAVRLALARRDQATEEQHLTGEARARRDRLLAQEREARRLEEQEPGITKVKWGLDGSVQLD